VIRATLDVNVLASAFLGRQTAPALIVQRWTGGRFELILSEHVLYGLDRTWQKRYFQTRYTGDQVQQTLALLRADAIMIAPTPSAQGVGEDEEDDLVLATAVAGDATYLVTGDRHLQAFGSFQDVTILSPRQFLDLLEIEPGIGS